MPVDLPSLRPQTQVSNYTNMVALITLTLKLGEIANEMLVPQNQFLERSADGLDRSSLRKCRKWQQPGCLEKLLTQRKQLLEWWATLPEETYCRDLNPAGGLFRSNVHLKLDYCLTRIFIGRPFLFSNVKGINPAASGGTSQASVNSRSKTRSVLVTDCVEAALEIVDLCRLLRDETGLARASYTEFSSCRAALLVILAQSLTKRTERLRNALSQGMGLIKIMSMGVGSARSAVNVIEALERAIRRLDDWSESQAQNRQDVVDSGYERFKNWEMLWKTGPISPATSATAATATTTNIANQIPRTSAGAAAPPSLSSPAAAAPTDVGNSTGSSRPELHSQNETTTAQVGSTSSTGAPVPHVDFAHSPAGSVTQPPHFGFDGFISNFPQELDEFAAIPCFDAEVSQGVGGEMDGGQGENDARWMPFMTD